MELTEQSNVGRAPDGDIVFANPAKVAHAAEEFECAWMYLDKIGVPTVSGDGGQYSLVGRIMAAIRGEPPDNVSNRDKAIALFLEMSLVPDDDACIDILTKAISGFSQAHNKLNVCQARLSQHEAVTKAAIHLCNFFWKSLDVGPDPKDPTREARYWRELRSAIRATTDDPSLTPASNQAKEAP